MWQFLFNPSELELDVGPEFKSSETWGVSDKGNSGQPLHWSHNTNAQLKFNSVLLNGYVFGRKVEALEQGLVELFMARDGQGQHGPYILEFVWGKRVFGPCVIRNVNIKEKMWDEGEVVNAELSFTLEQVPEWTINDGFVDVARPGRLAVEGDPTKTSTSTTTTPTTTTGQDKPNPGGGGQPGQKPPVPAQSADFTKCKRIQSDLDSVIAVQKFIASSQVSNSSRIFFGSGWAPSFNSALDKYNSLLAKYKNSPTYKQFFTTKYLAQKCLAPGGNLYGIGANHAKEYKSAQDLQQKTLVDNKYKRELANCAGLMSAAGGPIKAAYLANNCNRFQASPSSRTESL
jgi:hypothetical protein